MAETKIVTIARDDDCDLYTDSSGNIAMTSGLEACAQIVNAKMRTVQGELQLNLDKGLPYFTTVFSGAEYIPLWRNEAVKMIENLDFVKSVESFVCFLDGDVMKYESTIVTNHGRINVNG